MKSIIITLIITLLLTSLIYSAKAAFSGQVFIVTFDNLPQVDSGGTAHVPTPYANLAWNNFYVASANNSVLMRPHSTPACTLGGLPDDPGSNITIHYPGSPIKAFDFVSTWVACVTFDGLPPEKCVVRFTGYKAHIHGIGSSANVTYDYAFSGGDINMMESLLLPKGFAGLATVDVVVAVNWSALGQVVQLDDVVVETYRDSDREETSMMLGTLYR